MHRDTLAAAQWMVNERRMSVIAVDSPDATHFPDDPKKIGKVPLWSWKAFQHALPSDDNLRAWFANGEPRNPAIVTGGISGIVVVDLDSPEAIAYGLQHLPHTEMRTKTARGEHWFYRHPGTPIPNKARLNTPDGQLEIDVRGDGGFVIAPTAKHASGIVYERLGTWPPVADLPVFNAEWLSDSETRALEPSEHTSTVDGALVSLRNPAEREHLRARARAYIARVPPAIEGQGGDAHTFQLACRLVRGFALDPADARDLLRDWNAGCLPPWSDRELDAKIEGALKYGTEPIGARAADRPFVATSRTDDHFALTDTGNGEAFAAWNGDAVRFDHRARRWLVWDRHRFMRDADAEVERRAKETIRRLQESAFAEADPDKRKAALKWLLTSESRQRREAMLACAKAEYPITDAGTQWDRDPWLLGVPNGVIELRTGSLRPGDPADRITMSASVAYDPAAHCPLWERVVSDIFGGDRPLVDYVQRALGYSLTGNTSEQALFLPYGAGSNGKGTLLNTFRWIIGDYGYQMPFSSVLLTRKDGASNDLAALDGRRFVLASEVNEGVRFDESRIKALTGCDPISARFLYAEFFEFIPVAKFWLAVNHKPVVRDDSHAFWRRMRLLPFERTFPINPTLANDLKAESAGILAWAVRGCLLWQAEGLGTPDAVASATAAYQRDSDQLADFLTEACDVDTDASIAAADLYRGYVGWAERQGFTDRERLNKTLFGRKAADRFTKTHTRAGKVYLGLRLRV